MIQTLLPVLMLSLLLGACAAPYSEVPLASNFPATQQKKLQAAAHWNSIANDIAKQISANLKNKPPLFVDPSFVKTEFDKAFSNQLISALVADGFNVVKSPGQALNVEIETHAVRFSANRPQHRHAGTATMIGAGVYALHLSRATPAAVAAATVAGADAYSWLHSEFASGPTPQTEIIITASVSDSNRYFTRSTSIYYVSDSDHRLYDYIAPYPTSTRTIGVTGQ